MHPERWLESLVVNQLGRLDETLDTSCVYSQVPAFSASDRAMIDVLTLTREGRLAVVELKADEGHSPAGTGPGLLVANSLAPRARRIQRFGYFPRGAATEPHCCFWLHLRCTFIPATDTLLHYFSPEINWICSGLTSAGERTIRVVFRKRPNRAANFARDA